MIECGAGGWRHWKVELGVMMVAPGGRITAIGRKMAVVAVYSVHCTGTRFAGGGGGEK